MSMRNTTLALGQLLRSVQAWRKVTSARGVTRCCTTGNLPLEVAPRQRKTHVNIYRRQTVHRGKVDPGVSELPQGNELSRDHVNRPLIWVTKGLKQCRLRFAVSVMEILYENIPLTEMLSSLKEAKKHVHIYCFLETDNFA